MARRLGVAGAVVAVTALVTSCGFGWTGPADQITDHQARLSGKAGSLTVGAMTFHFEYGTTDAYGSSTSPRTFTIADIHEPLFVRDVAQGLAAGTEYHYRLCAVDADGNGSCGGDATFTTNAGHDSVNGYGAILTNDSIYGSVGGSINVTAGVDGSYPVGSASFTPPTPTATKPYLEGEVTCVRVEGNRATIGFFGVWPGSSLGGPVVLVVEDNAATGAPDRFAVKDVTQVPATCPVPTDADFTSMTVYIAGHPFTFGPNIVYGDFVVHDES